MTSQEEEIKTNYNRYIESVKKLYDEDENFLFSISDFFLKESAKIDKKKSSKSKYPIISKKKLDFNSPCPVLTSVFENITIFNLTGKKTNFSIKKPNTNNYNLVITPEQGKLTFLFYFFYLFLFIFIYFYLFLFIFVYFYLFLFIFIYFYFFFFYFYLFLFIFILFLFIFIFYFIFILNFFYPILLFAKKKKKKGTIQKGKSVTIKIEINCLYTCFANDFLLCEFEDNLNQLIVLDFESELSFNLLYDELLFEKKVNEGAQGSIFKGKWRSNDVAIKQMYGEEFHTEFQILRYFYFLFIFIFIFTLFYFI